MMWPWSKRRDEAEQAMVERRVAAAAHRADDLSTRLRVTVKDLVEVLDPKKEQRP